MKLFKLFKALHGKALPTLINSGNPCKIDGQIKAQIETIDTLLQRDNSGRFG